MKYTILSLKYCPRFCENNRIFLVITNLSHLNAKPQIYSRGENQPTSQNTSFVAALRRFDRCLEQKERLNANLATKTGWTQSFAWNSLLYPSRNFSTFTFHSFREFPHDKRPFHTSIDEHVIMVFRRFYASWRKQKREYFSRTPEFKLSPNFIW